MSPKSKKQISTHGGAYVYGDVITAGGAFIGHDQINQYQVFSYTYRADQAEERYLQFIQGKPRPYLPDQPFSTAQASLFAGREEQRDKIVTRLRDQNQRTLLVSGPADIGKSSLLSAGVIPELCKEGALIVHLNDYSHPEALIRAALLGQANQLEIKVNKNTPLPEMIEKITSSTHQGVILILDQFERYYLNINRLLEQQALHEQLASTMQRVEASHFHVLIAIRQDWQARFDSEWGDELPGVRMNPIQLLPLTTDEAQRAIEHPLGALRQIPNVGEYVQYNETVVGQRLLPDLDALDDIVDGSILPSDLQIVCDRLYETARSRPRQPLITEGLYLEVSQGKGVEKIIDIHFETILERIPAAYRGLAREISSLMLDASPQFWIKAEEIRPEGADRQEVERALEKMVEAKLLIWHTEEELKAYAFASHSIANAAYRIAGPDARRRFQSRNELKYIWRAWNTYDAFASPSQLDYLQEYAPPPEEFLPERAILLLRSAITNHTDPAPWLERLYTRTAQTMLCQVEEGHQELLDPSDRLTRYNQLRTLLGVYDLETGKNFQDQGPGVIALTAATHPEEICRQTAALALMSVYNQAALTRLREAVAKNNRGAWRLSELYGMLADGAQALSQLSVELEPGKLGRRRLKELDHLLNRLKSWLAKVEVKLSVDPEQAVVRDILKDNKQAIGRLARELDAGRLDILPREQRGQLIEDLNRALTRLNEIFKEPDGSHLGLAKPAFALEACIQTLDRFAKWIKISPADAERLIEHRQQLQEASCTVLDEIKNLPSTFDRLRVWWWRFVNRVKADGHYIWRLTLGGALGAGIGLGLLRALLSLLLLQSPGFYFYNYFPMGFITGGGLALGLLLSNVVRLGPPEHGPSSPGRRSFWLAMLLGSLGFALGNILLNFILLPASLITPSLVLPLAILAGLGLSLVVYDQPLAGWRIGVLRWAGRLACVAIAFSSVQTIFILTEAHKWGLALAFGWSGYFFRAYLMDTLYKLGLGGFISVPGWFHYPAILDSALTGMALAVGLTMGLILASQSYRRWERQASQTGV